MDDEAKAAQAGKNKAFKIEHDRPGCIGCGACAAIFPERWAMNEDGKSDVIGGKRKGDGTEELDIDEDEFGGNMDAAKSCPVNVIHLKKRETGEKLI